jgi:hypothetical protein
VSHTETRSSTNGKNIETEPSNNNSQQTTNVENTKIINDNPFKPDITQNFEDKIFDLAKQNKIPRNRFNKSKIFWRNWMGKFSARFK